MYVMKRKSFPKITKNVIILIILSNFIICSLVFAASYWAFNHQFREQYDSSIREIASAARAYLNPDDFAKYLEKPEKDEKYETTLNLLQTMVDNFDLNVIYVSAVEAPEYTHITYFYDPVNKHGKWSPYPLGYQEDYYEQSYNKTTRRVYEEGVDLVRHTIKSRNGSHITAQVPVFDSTGKIVALLGAQKNIQEFVDARRSFIKFVISITLIFTTAFVMLFASYFNFYFIKPIILITKETDDFASFNNVPSNKLLNVKKHDELGTLAHSVYKMETIVAHNIQALSKMTTETALALATAIDAKDSYTHGHSTRVAEYSQKIAQLSGKSDTECRDIYLAALMHDVGKIGVPNSIINKQGKLTEEEYRVIKAHPIIGRQILSNIKQAQHIADGAYYHHERYDGKGYPTGIHGKNIPDVARIIAVADAYDAMTSNRSYRGTLLQDYVRSEIEKGIGSQFDPKYARIMLKLIDEDKDYKMRETPDE